MDARPLPPHPQPELYSQHAVGLLQASASPDSLHAWVLQWVRSNAEEAARTQAQLRGATLTPQLRALAERQEIARVEHLIQHAAPAQLADAESLIARLHGFDSWPDFEHHLQALRRPSSSEARLEAAADAIVSGNLSTLRQLLLQDPGLITARSARSHHGTLLHYVSANGIENFRQTTPPNIVEIATFLLNSGADVNAACDAYGGGSMLLMLAATSVHPERAGLQEPLLQLLLDRGALLQGPPGKPHALLQGCLANGRGAAARFLAARGAPLDLETAAGSGRFDFVQSCFTAEGALLPPATPEQLQRGFLWASEYGHLQIVEFLLDRGADLLDSAGTNETALHWAVIGAQLPVLKFLLSRGAPLEELNAYGGTALGQAAWSFDNGSESLDLDPIFEALLAAGARIEDDWLDWLEHESPRPPEHRARLAALFRRCGAGS